jgi:formyl-CoA transferase
MYSLLYPDFMKSSNDKVLAPSPLSGIRVVEIGQLIAGPFAARVLADFGANVIKIEAPKTGDPLRYWRAMHGDTSIWWEVQSRNKKSVVLDLKSEQGQGVLKRMLSEADVLIENFKPGTLERWGLDYQSLASVNPKLIMLRVSGYGQTGPYAHRPGFGVVGEAMGGLRYLTGEPRRKPVRVGFSIGDTLAGLHGVIGVLLALQERHRSGQGQEIDVSLYESVFNCTESMLTEHALTGEIREPAGSSLPGIVPSDAYKTNNGLVVIAGNGDGIFKRLMYCIGRADLAEDPSLAGNQGRIRRVDEIDSAIEQWSCQRSVNEVLQALEESNVPAGRIYTAEDIYHDPHYQARGMFVKTKTKTGCEYVQPGIVPKLGRTPGQIRMAAPRLGEHTNEVVREFGRER